MALPSRANIECRTPFLILLPQLAVDLDSTSIAKPQHTNALHIQSPRLKASEVGQCIRMGLLGEGHYRGIRKIALLHKETRLPMLLNPVWACLDSNQGPPAYQASALTS